MIVPLSSDVSTANVHDGNMYCTLVDPLAGLVENVLCDPAYDDSKLYQFSNKKNLRLITPIKQYPRTPPERIKLADFYNSNECQELYRNRKVSIEPLFDIFKDTSNIRTVPVKGLSNVKSFVLICVLVGSVLQLYYWSRESKNCKKNALLLGNSLN